MNVKEERICRVCLKVAENDFEIIDEMTRNVFGFLLLRVNLDIIKDPIICKDCADISQKCFNFKSVCMGTEDLLLSYVTDKNRAKDGRNKTVDGNSVCRFCVNQLKGSNLVLLETLMNDVMFAEMLKVLMPEMDFNIMNNPVVCTNCKQDLECYMMFAENCLDVEQKITKYFQNEATGPSIQVKLSEILYCKNIVGSDNIQMHTVKQEEDTLEDVGEPSLNIYDDTIMKTEGMFIKNEQPNLNEIVCDIGSDMSSFKFNIPHNDWNTSIQNDSFTPTPVDYRKCVCGPTQPCSNICNSQSNVSSLEAYQTLYKYETNKPSISEAQMFKCTICTYQTKRKGTLKRHMLIHKDITEVETYKCPTCIYETKHKFRLKSHMSIHGDIKEVKMYKCATCTFESKDKSNLKRHMKVHMDITEMEMYKCLMCDYQAKLKGSLKTHMLIHKDITEVEMYKCSVCTYETKYKRSLKCHMLIHKSITEQEMYKCSMCTYQTKVKGSLKQHILAHKNLTEVEMYNCAMCTYETIDKGHLKRHMLVHKNIPEQEMDKCSMCTFKTKYKGHLKRHMVIHKEITEVDIYKCTMCTYETKVKDYLKKHVMIHKKNAEVEMFKCSMCVFKTKRKYNLKTHMLIHTHSRNGSV